jgi:hypothetical protein
MATNLNGLKRDLDRLRAKGGGAAGAFAVASLTEEQVAQICAGVPADSPLGRWVTGWRVEQSVEFCRRVARHERDYGPDADPRIRRYTEQCDRELDEWHRANGLKPLGRSEEPIRGFGMKAYEPP